MGEDVADLGQLRQQVGDDPRLRGGRHLARPTASRPPIKGIQEAGGDVEVYDYPGSSHAFFNDQRPEVHDKEHSAKAWRRTIDLLKSRL